MYNLLGHMHLHAGSKPFKCPYCTSKFNLKGNLSRHMKVKHGITDTSVDGQGEELYFISPSLMTFPLCVSVANLSGRACAALLSLSLSLMHFDSACTLIWWLSVVMSLCHSLPGCLVNIAVPGLDMPACISRD